MKKIAQTWAAFSAAFLLAFAPVFAFAGTGSTGAPPASLTRTFTSSTTDTVPSWASGAFVTLQAGGGGGAVGTSGGSSGEGWLDLFTPVTGGTSLTITVGAGGASALTGGDTSISGAGAAIPTAKGGRGGGIGPAGNPTPWFDGNGLGFGANQTASTNSIVYDMHLVPQQVSTSSVPLFCVNFDGSVIALNTGAAGGCSHFGKGGSGSPTTGSPGTGFGSGGGAGATAGGAGAPGLVIIRYVQ